MIYIASDIQYDTTDSISKDLPKEIKIDVPDDLVDDYEILEFISDKISDITEFCNLGFSTTPKLNI